MPGKEYETKQGKSIVWKLISEMMRLPVELSMRVALVTQNSITPTHSFDKSARLNVSAA
jgi:hypothetical protein